MKIINLTFEQLVSKICLSILSGCAFLWLVNKAIYCAPIYLAKYNSGQIVGHVVLAMIAVPALLIVLISSYSVLNGRGSH
jgi:hypothetical protein